MYNFFQYVCSRATLAEINLHVYGHFLDYIANLCNGRRCEQEETTRTMKCIVRAHVRCTYTVNRFFILYRWKKFLYCEAFNLLTFRGVQVRMGGFARKQVRGVLVENDERSKIIAVFVIFVFLSRNRISFYYFFLNEQQWVCNL